MTKDKASEEVRLSDALEAALDEIREDCGLTPPEISNLTRILADLDQHGAEALAALEELELNRPSSPNLARIRQVLKQTLAEFDRGDEGEGGDEEEEEEETIHRQEEASTSINVDVLTTAPSRCCCANPDPCWGLLCLLLRRRVLVEVSVSVVLFTALVIFIIWEWERTGMA